MPRIPLFDPAAQYGPLLPDLRARFAAVLDDGQFILLAEGKDPISSPGYDHLGLLMDTREEVDAVRDECQRFAEKDDRMRLKLYEDLVTPPVVTHAFYVKYLLPIWFDVQCIERTAGPEPEHHWEYV